MRNTEKIKHLKIIEDAVKESAKGFNRTLPEIRFFELDAFEFMCLLEKGVYPSSPPNLWEGQEIKKRKQRVKDGLESALYYEVVQTGDPSYAYLNHSNSPTTQASVMAHVIGHCEFSEINVMKDSEELRTEYAMFLTRKCAFARNQMGFSKYRDFWNECKSLEPYVFPNSQFNLTNSVETDNNSLATDITEVDEEPELFIPFSSTLGTMFDKSDSKQIVKKLQEKKADNESISRKGYALKLPCQDILGFLANHAPLSDSEKQIIDYIYFVNSHYDFVRRTQIMNEGWAMYWEKKIMMELFEGDVVDEIIDYSKKFSGVLYPRPFFQRNPYHLGYNMWHSIEEEFQKGMITSEYRNETDLETKLTWDKKPEGDSLEFIEDVVKTCTDYGFLKRFLTDSRITDFHLNRVPKQMGVKLEPEMIINEDKYNVYVEPEICKDHMLSFFVDYFRPRIYIVNDDYNNGGLLLFHRYNGKDLREDWMKPTLKNLSRIWHGDCYIMSNNVIYSMRGKTYNATKISRVFEFEEIVELMKQGQKVTPS
jgi:stage V sporulation protein R